MGLSPDGRLLAVTLSQGKRRVPHDTSIGPANGAHIVLIDVESGESMEPFSDLQMSWAGRWSPDGQTLAAYVVQKDAHACVGLWNRPTREVFVVSNATIARIFPANIPQWTPDGRRIIVPMIPKDRDSTMSRDIVVHSYAPGGPASDQHSPLVDKPEFSKCVGVVDVNSGVVTEFAPGLSPGILRMAPDGQAVALPNRITSPVDRPHLIVDVNVVPLDGRDFYTVAENVPVNAQFSRISWSPDCQTISYISGGKWGDPQHLHCVPADGSSEPTMMTEITSSLGNFQLPWWTDDGTRLVWLQDGFLMHLSIAEGRSRRLSKDSTGNHLWINAIVQRHGESVLHTDDRGDILAIATDTRENMKFVVRINSVSGEMATV